MMTATLGSASSTATQSPKAQGIARVGLGPLSPITNGVPRPAGLKKRNSPRLVPQPDSSKPSDSSSTEKKQRHHHRRKREDLRKKVLNQKKRGNHDNRRTSKPSHRKQDSAACPTKVSQPLQQDEESRQQPCTSSLPQGAVKTPAGPSSAVPSRKRKPPSPYFKGRSEAERLEKLVDFLVQKCTQLQSTLVSLTEEKTRKDASLRKMEDKNGVFAERLKGLSARNARLMEANNNLHSMLESAVGEAEAAARALQEQQELNKQLEALHQQQEREPKQILNWCKHCKRDTFEEEKGNDAVPAEQPFKVHVQDLEHSELNSENKVEDFTPLSFVADTTLGTIEEEGEEDEERWLCDETASSAVGATNLSGNSSIGAVLEQSSNQCECDIFGWDGPGHSPACDCWVVGS